MRAVPRIEREQVRRIGAALLAAAAMWVLFGLAPQDTTTALDISSVMLDDSLNQKRAEGAPQQSVVNGWTARDLLEILAKQGEQRDNRPAALLTLGVLALALGLATSPPLAESRRRAPEGTSVESPAEERVAMPLPGDTGFSDGGAKLPVSPAQNS